MLIKSWIMHDPVGVEDIVPEKDEFLNEDDCMTITAGQVLVVIIRVRDGQPHWPD